MFDDMASHSWMYILAASSLSPAFSKPFAAFATPPKSALSAQPLPSTCESALLKMAAMRGR